MKTFRISVPDMQSEHCMKNVRRAIETIEEVEIIELTSGGVVVGSDNSELFQSVIEVINAAGYSTDDSVRIKPETLNDETTLRFKTNINCPGCVRKVSESLDNTEGVCHWEVDLIDKDKVLSVVVNETSEVEIIKAVQDKGFRIEKI